MERTRRLRLLPEMETNYADRLKNAKDRVQQAQLVLRVEIKALERLLLTNEPEGRVH